MSEKPRSRSAAGSGARAGSGNGGPSSDPQRLGTWVLVLARADRYDGAMSSRRVLVVEDDDDAREALCEILVMWGHTVQGAGSGSQAVNCAAGFDAEIALVDVGLPDLDGYELARALRRAGSRSYLVALTGQAGAEQRKKALDAGFDVHLVKPVAPSRLEELIRLAPARGTC